MGRGSRFNLIELMVAIAIVALLAGIAVPAYSEYQARAKFVERDIVMDLIMSATRAYHSDASTRNNWWATGEFGDPNTDWVGYNGVQPVTGDRTKLRPWVPGQPFFDGFGISVTQGTRCEYQLTFYAGDQLWLKVICDVDGDGNQHNTDFWFCLSNGNILGAPGVQCGEWMIPEQWYIGRQPGWWTDPDPLLNPCSQEPWDHCY